MESYTIEDYINNNKKDAHIKLYVQLKLTMNEEEFYSISDDMILNFDLGGIRYSISMFDLKEKCREESSHYYDFGNGSSE